MSLLCTLLSYIFNLCTAYGRYIFYINLMETRDKEKYFYMMKNESHVIFFKPNYTYHDAGYNNVCYTDVQLNQGTSGNTKYVTRFKFMR